MKISIFFTIFLVFLNSSMAADEPEFNLIFKDNNFEIRQYKPKILAQISVSGDFDDASSKGFKILADFIFGNNISASGSLKIDMTTPVVMEPLSKLIDMTTPILTEGENKDWIVSFIMPKEYLLNTLPKPNNRDIKITSLPAEKYAVIVFSGLVRESSFDKQATLFFNFIKNKNLTTIGAIQIARYNPPWTLPFFRRNELMIRIN
jgi:hypothetical protein|tara:strand:+ start:151 stop:765 length:615 start_codon:yes stop_codon:yes gene_type:complete